MRGRARRLRGRGLAPQQTDLTAGTNSPHFYSVASRVNHSPGQKWRGAFQFQPRQFSSAAVSAATKTLNASSPKNGEHRLHTAFQSIFTLASARRCDLGRMANEAGQRLKNYRRSAVRAG